MLRFTLSFLQQLFDVLGECVRGIAHRAQHLGRFASRSNRLFRFFLERLVNQHPDSKILVFVRTKVRAERVSKAMERAGIETIFIHSGKDQDERNEVMRQFRNGKIKVLIATDVTARGIDIPDVDYVVNYDLPDKAENYVHRVGRTGRGTKYGQALTFCSTEEKPMLAEVEKYVLKKIAILDLTRADKEEAIIFSKDPVIDMKKLMEEVEAFEQSRKRKKNKKGK